MPTSEDYIIRPLEADDYGRGYLSLLAELTTVGDISRPKFVAHLATLSPSTYRLFVLVAKSDPSLIIGAGTLLIESKFIHACGSVGHIEDIVIAASERGKSLGKLMIARLVEEARASGCYKVILDCSEANVAFYEKCGLTRKEVQMVQYF